MTVMSFLALLIIFHCHFLNSQADLMVGAEAMEGIESIPIFQLKSSVSDDMTRVGKEFTCNAETVHDRNYGGFKFPRTVASIDGTIAYAACPYSEMDSGARDFLSKETISGNHGDLDSIARAAGTRFCSIPLGTMLPHWNRFEARGCRSLSMDMTIESMKNTTVDPVTKDNINQLMDHLKPLAENAVLDYQSAATMLEAINHALAAVELFDDPLMLEIRHDLFAHLEEYTKKVGVGKGQRVHVPSPHITIESLIFPDDGKDYSYTFETFQLPSEAIAMARGSKSTARLQIKGYSDALFGHWGKKRNWDNGGNDTAIPIHSLGSKWRIYDVQFDGVDIVNLKSPISFMMTVNRSAGYEWVCAFWNVTESAWSKEGMRTIRFRDSIRCEAAHLTAFSVLLDPIPREPESPGTWKVHDHILSIISSVGSSLSMAGLILTMLTYSIFRKLRRERSNRILLNLSLALFLLHLTSLSAGKETWNGFCALPAALLHYFLLSSLGWMLLDAIFMYRILISVFVQPETKFLMKRLLIGWGVPLLLVVLTGTLDPKVYQEGRGSLCVIAGHLNVPLYYVTYLGPSILILLTNAIVFGRIIIVLYQQNKRKRKESAMGKRGIGKKPSMLSPIQTKGALTLFVVFGLGWIVGFGGIGPLEIPMKYLYTILNSGQGLLVFILRVVLDGKVIQTVRRSVLSESESNYNNTSGMSGTAMTGVHGPPFGRHDDSRTSFSATAPAIIPSPSGSPTNIPRRLDPFGRKLGVTFEENGTTNEGPFAKY